MSNIKRTVSGFLARQGNGINNRKAFAKRLARAVARGEIKRWPARKSRYKRDRWLYDERDLRRVAAFVRGGIRMSGKGGMPYVEPAPLPVDACGEVTSRTEPTELDAVMRQESGERGCGWMAAVLLATAVLAGLVAAAVA